MSNCYNTDNLIDQIVSTEYEYRNITGANNNLQHPEWNLAGSKLLRLLPSAYMDNKNIPSGQDRPSARKISNEIFAQDCPNPNKFCASNLFWTWGQFIGHDIIIVSQGKESFPILVPIGDKHFDPAKTGNMVMPFNRSLNHVSTRYNDQVREQFNALTPLIDGTGIYGETKKRNSYIRKFKYGLLRLSEGGLLPLNDGSIKNNKGSKSIFVSGDKRSNENMGLLSLHTLFVREHNYWAKKIYCASPNMCDEEIYQRAKIIIEAELQAITYNEFLQLLLGENGLGEYSGYNPDRNPQITNVFTTAAYRLHSLVASKVHKCSKMKLKDMFFKPFLLSNNGGIDPILIDFSSTVCEEMDGHVIDDLRNFLFGKPGFGGLDLVSLNIQRGRDHGLPDYNTARETIGLPKITSFSDLTPDKCIQHKLESLYKTVNNIDIIVGGLLEEHVHGSMLGPLFHTIIKEQFERIRDGDRFWYENRLSDELIDLVNSTKLSDIIKRNTCICDIQPNVFVLPENKNDNPHCNTCSEHCH